MAKELRGGQGTIMTRMTRVELNVLFKSKAFKDYPDNEDDSP